MRWAVTGRRRLEMAEDEARGGWAEAEVASSETVTPASTLSWSLPGPGGSWHQTTQMWGAAHAALKRWQILSCECFEPWQFYLPGSEAWYPTKSYGYKRSLYGVTDTSLSKQRIIHVFCTFSFISYQQYSKCSLHKKTIVIKSISVLCDAECWGADTKSSFDSNLIRWTMTSEWFNGHFSIVL